MNDAAQPSVGVAGSAADVVFWFDRLSVFDGRMHAAGWVVTRLAETSIVGLELSFGTGVRVPLASFGHSSPDLALHYGPHAQANRFDEVVELDAATSATFDPVLRVTLSAGPPIEIQNLSLQCASLDAVHQLTQKFVERVQRMPAGLALEIGSRRVVGASLRHQFSPDWAWVGVDVHPGHGVDVVADAHELSRVFPEEHFDAALSLAVFEHLLMPWKVAIELNKVMKTGAIGYVVAPGAWPAHEEPWDYWRYSAHGFAALFNRATGFEIIEAQQGERATLVAERLHGAVNFAPSAVCYLMSAVLFRKVGPTSLDWPVSMSEIVSSAYPK